MILTLKERKYASRCALRVLDAALRDNGANCERFVDIRGFKTLFPLVGGAPPPQPSFAKGEGRSRPPPASPPAARIAAYTAGRRICTTTRTHSTPLVAHTDPAVSPIRRFRRSGGFASCYDRAPRDSPPAASPQARRSVRRRRRSLMRACSASCARSSTSLSTSVGCGSSGSWRRRGWKSSISCSACATSTPRRWRSPPQQSRR